MTDQLTILGISGSLRRASANTGLLRAARELAPAGVAVVIHDIGDLPLYNGDIDGGEGKQPEPVARLKAAIAAADALLIATPEYNYSVTGALKNAIDWASRPPPSSPLNGKPLAIMGAGGRFGTVRSQLHLRQIAIFTNMLPLNKPEVLIDRAFEKVDQHGDLTDPASRDAVRGLVEALAAWTRQLRAGA